MNESVKSYLEDLMRKCDMGFHDFEWHYGRDGWYVMCHTKRGYLTSVNIGDFINHKLDLEIANRG